MTLFASPGDTAAHPQPLDEARCHVLRAFVFDDPAAARPFSRRLADEQGWTPAYTARVLTEYRRFLELAATSDTAVTPSVDVDQAWHLHLTYTQSYWEDLCGTVLGRPLHHGPSRGGASQRAHYRDQYADTLTRYAARFGTTPPPDIWPPVTDRFAPDAEPIVVRPRTHWVLHKRETLRVAAAGIVVASAGLLLAGQPPLLAMATTALAPLLLLVGQSVAPPTPLVPTHLTPQASRATASSTRRRDKERDSGSSGSDTGWWGDSGSSSCSDSGSSDSGSCGDGGGGDGGCGGGGCGGGCS